MVAPRKISRVSYPENGIAVGGASSRADPASQARRMEGNRPGTAYNYIVIRAWTDPFTPFQGELL
jgi:hypothetical protein